MKIPVRSRGQAQALISLIGQIKESAQECDILPDKNPLRSV
jgi:hypothetical protein